MFTWGYSSEVGKRIGRRVSAGIGSRRKKSDRRVGGREIAISNGSEKYEFERIEQQKSDVALNYDQCSSEDTGAEVVPTGSISEKNNRFDVNHCDVFHREDNKLEVSGVEYILNKNADIMVPDIVYTSLSLSIQEVMMMWNLRKFTRDL